MYFVLHIKRFLYDNNRKDNYKPNEPLNIIKAPASLCILSGEMTGTKMSAENLSSLPICVIMVWVMKMDELKNRKTTRLKGADYNRNQAVFLTICMKERRCVLSRIVGTGVLDGPQIELTKYGQIADKYIRQLNDFYDDLSVESYVIMPNHIHIMLWVKGAGNGPSRTPVPTKQVQTSL